MNVLVIGTGLLGQKCVESWSESHDVFYTWRSEDPISNDAGYGLDITNIPRFADIVSKVEPDNVVLTAAYTDVDGCEENPGKAYRVNAEAPGKIAKVCKREGIGLVYISTDYVFDGEKGRYKENDSTNPVCVYGESKLKGERNVMQNRPDPVIARTSVIFGWERANFATWVTDSLEKGEKIPVVHDKYVSPTLNADLADQLERLMVKNESGIYHASGRTRASFFEFAELLAEKTGCPTDLVERAKTEDLPWKAERPKDSSLDTSKIERIANPRTLEDSIDLLLSQKPGITA